jgi:hypothetical protein
VDAEADLALVAVADDAHRRILSYAP